MKTTLKNTISIIAFFCLSLNLVQAESIISQQLTSFNYEIGTRITWATSYEIEGSYFVIEKSSDGTDFTAITKMKGKGNASSENQYNFLDVSVSKETTTYRLIEMGLTGNRIVLDQMSVQNDRKTSFQIKKWTQLANNSGVFSIDLEIAKDVTVQVKVTNWKNEMLNQLSDNLIAGESNILIDLSQYENGLYKIEIIIDKEEATLNLLKNDKSKFKLPIKALD